VRRRRRRSLPQVLLPLGLAAAATVCAVIGLDRPAPAAPAVAAAPGQPVLSAARLPAAGAHLAADEQLGLSLDGVLGAPPAAGWQACAEVDDGGVAVYVHNGAAPLVPASNLKLLTADAALARLGAGATFTTSVAAASPPAKGVVDGPLYLVGGGDPLLATDGYRRSERAWTESAEPVTRLAALADAVKAAGVSRVGGVVGDDSRFDGERTVPSWQASYLADGEVGRVSALEVDGGTVVAGGRRVPAADPALSAASAFAALLRQRGIAVAGPVAHATAPKGAVTLAAVHSPPLTTVIGETLRESDNLAAEMLVKALGGGTWPGGVAAVHATLVAEGIPVQGVVQVDGSGLDRADRVPCASVAAVLATGRLEPELPVAARCGTLVGRMVGQPGAQRVIAKTGSLTGVVALSGAVSAAPLPPQPCPPAGASAEPVTFALLLNGTFTTAAGEGAADRVADVVATYAGAA
jgi:D-alanyl-D-alanine carboxypeptidase/D-alanyl-D-alanine-endopeptidase (penicillin-binding protein 4)